MWWNKAAPQPLAAGEAWQRELQLLLWHLQPINRTCLHRKWKCLHCLCCFPEFWQEDRKGGNRDMAVKSLPWALSLTRAGNRRGPCSFTLPTTPLSCLAHSRMSGTWVNHNAGIVLPFSQETAWEPKKLPSLSHILGELWTLVLWDCLIKAILAQGAVTCLPVLWGKKIYRKMQVCPLKSWQTMYSAAVSEILGFYWEKMYWESFRLCPIKWDLRIL